MKTIIAFILLLNSWFFAGITVPANAQTITSTDVKGRWSVAGRADKLTDKISHKVKLSNDQHKKIYEINTDIIRRMDEVKANSLLSKKDRMTQMKALDSERSQRFKNVFNAAQYKVWNNWEINKKEQLETKMERKRLRKASKGAADNNKKELQ